MLMCEFEEGLPDAWDNLDLDGAYIAPHFWANTKLAYLEDGNINNLKAAWVLTEDIYTKKCLVSPALFNSSSTRANDWLITPSIKVPEEGAKAEWLTRSVTEQYLGSYEVRIIESDTYESLMADFYSGIITTISRLSTALSESSTVIDAINREGLNWTKRNALLSEYKGKDIRIIWRDNDQSGMGILIDNVLITEGEDGIAPVIGAWTEEFMGGNVPLQWNMDVIGWQVSSKWSTSTLIPDYVNDDMVWFDAFYSTAGDEGSVESMRFQPRPNSYILQYDVEKLIYAPLYVKPGLELFLEISTDGGKNFIASDENILSELPEYEGEEIGTTTGKTTLEKDLSDYIGQNIVVRFRGVSNKGGENFILWRVELIESDDIAPIVEFLTPEDRESKVALNTEISVQFDREITALDLKKVVLREKGGEAVNIKTKINFDTLFITHDGLEEETEYEVILPIGSIKALAEPITWSFSTSEDMAPIAQTFTPEDRERGVALDTEISVQFDKEISALDLNTIVLKEKGGEAVEVTAEINFDTLFILHNGLKESTEYEVNIPVGTIESLIEPITWSFTTGKSSNIDDVNTIGSVIPTLTTGNLTVTSEPGAEVKVLDISGRILSRYTSTGHLNITLDYDNGIYIILIEGTAVSSHKVILKK